MEYYTCIKKPNQCQDEKLKMKLQSGKTVLFNGIKKGMGLIRNIGTRNRYNKKRKHLKKAMKQIRKMRKVLKHLSRQLHKAMISAAHDG